jgi:1-acyl-sn-glycerol-3-phosphate acyltransferase
MRNGRRVRRTGWARSTPVRALREFVQVIGVKNVIRRELSVEVYGLDELRQREGAALIVANHASHLDTAVLLSTLPTKRRRRTAVGVASGYFFDSALRTGASAIAFNTFPIEQDGAVTTTPAKLLAKGWSVVLFPEGSRSRDGFVGSFQIDAAEIAVNAGVAVVPVGILGTYAAMPRGSNRPVPGRPRVSVRYGPSIIPEPDETPGEFATKIFNAVNKLLAEDAATWWKVQQGVADVPEPPASSWRRIWQQSDPPVKGGKPPAEKIWRR